MNHFFGKRSESYLFQVKLSVKILKVVTILPRMAKYEGIYKQGFFNKTKMGYRKTRHFSSVPRDSPGARYNLLRNVPRVY